MARLSVDEPLPEAVFRSVTLTFKFSCGTVPSALSVSSQLAVTLKVSPLIFRSVLTEPLSLCPADRVPGVQLAEMHVVLNKITPSPKQTLDVAATVAARMSPIRIALCKIGLHP